MTSPVVLTASPDLPGETPAEIIAAADHASRVDAATSAGAHTFVEELPRLPSGKLAKRLFSDDVRGLTPPG